MAYRLYVENELGERLELTANPNFAVLKVDGTNPPVAAINTVPVVGMDGTKYNSGRIEQRNIVILLNINQPIEQNRLTLYRYFRVKRKVTLYYENNSRRCHIDGYVESFENSLWTKLQQPQISIICPQPFWIAENDTVADFMQVIPLFEFPFDIPAAGIEFSQLQTVTSMLIDVGEIETGGIITMQAMAADVVNPRFTNSTTGKFFGVDISMQLDDIITINTRRGEKSVTLTRGSSVTNLLNDRLTGSEWVQFVPGVNSIGYSASAGTSHLKVSVSVTQLYEGV